MTNKIGEKIKYLRKKSNVTQEKFAEYLGITFQAVSRWESGTCYPDLEILPAIANYFNISTDELLGVDNVNKKERLIEIYDQLRENSSKGLIDENIAICRTAVNEFPNDFDLLSSLAFYLGKKNETRKEAISINERILADCTDDDIRYSVMQKLAYDYKSIGEKEKAIETAKKLPGIYTTSHILLSDIYDGENKITQLKINIENFCDCFTSDIMNFARTKYNDDKDAASVQKRIKLYQKAIDIYRIIYEDGDYGFYNSRMNNVCMGMANNYLLLDDFHNALDCLEKAGDYAIAFDTLPKIFTHTSIIFENNEFSKTKNLSKDYAHNDSYGMIQHLLNDIKYNPIGETERFKSIIAKLEQYAAKEA